MSGEDLHRLEQTRRKPRAAVVKSLDSCAPARPAETLLFICLLSSQFTRLVAAAVAIGANQDVQLDICPPLQRF